MDGCEVRLARPDDPFAAAFPHVKPATIATWLRPDHIFQVLLRDGALAGYRCVATTVTPAVRGFFRLGPHQVFVIDHFVRPELRRLGLARIMKFSMAREAVARGFSEAFGIEAPTNYDVIVSNPRRNVMRMGTLARTCSLGRVRFTLTPVIALTPELVQRQLTLLRQVAPRVSHAGVLFNPTPVTTDTETEQATAAGVTALGARLTFLPVCDTVDQTRAFEEAFAAGHNAGIQGLIVVSDPLLKEYRRLIVRLVERFRLPAVYDAREFVAVGGLMSYGSPPPSFTDFESAMAQWNGAKAGTHPAPGVRTPRFDTNRKAAARLGLVIPPDLVSTFARQRDGSGTEDSRSA
jgi:putative ABC transport system substrate-binding protein